MLRAGARDITVNINKVETRSAPSKDSKGPNSNMCGKFGHIHTKFPRTQKNIFGHIHTKCPRRRIKEDTS
jgi:hypothetical protein